MTTAIKEMETMILECAKLDREINNFVDVMKQATSEVRRIYQNNPRT